MEYKQNIAIKNNRTNRYLTLDLNNKLQASGCHPFFKHSECNKQREIFQILNAANQEYVGPIIMQSAILIYNPGFQGYLCCQQNGELKFENIPSNEASSSKATKFIICNTSNLKKAITENDEIVFKFNETNFLISELSLACNWNGSTISQDSTWKLQRSNHPPLPEWFSSRSFISLGYLQQSEQFMTCLIKQNDKKPIGSHSFQIQSIYLIEDLLYAMMSIEGTYIKKKTGTFEYQIEGHLEQSTCDLSLQQLISKILPMCSQHDQIEYFIQQKMKFENGYVSQAFCSALKELMQKYILMVNQLDFEFLQGEITLQKFWYFAQPSIRILNSIFVLTQNVIKQTGGQLLSTIAHYLNTSTDPKIVEVYQFLLQKSFVPYMKLLSNWIYFGEVDDPFEEFLISEKKIQKVSLETDYKNDFWDQRFGLRMNQIPKFLEKYADIILRTGKYINVIGVKESPFENYLIKNQGQIVEAQDFSHLLSCFEWANKEIIKLLFQKENIHKRLKTIKTFFLFDSGDFFIHFIEAAELELIKEARELSKEKLESLFDLAIRSTATNDHYKEDLLCYIDQYTINEQIYAMRNLKGIDINENKPPRAQKLKGMDLFTLDIKVEWPANLIFSRASLLNYQILFRTILGLNYLLKQLNEAWIFQKQLKETGLHQQFLKQNALLFRMQHLIKNYLYFISYDVIEKNYQSLLSNLQNNDNFEEVKENHMKFSENCLKESLIIDQEFWKIFSKCTGICSQFSIQIQKQNQSLVSYFNEDIVPKKAQIVEKIKELVSGQQFTVLYETFIKNFDDSYRELIRLIKQYISQSKTFIVSLMIRLDYQFDYL